MHSFFRLVALLLILLSYQRSGAQGLMVSGELTDPDGNLIGLQEPFLTDASVCLYDTAQSGTPLYTETFKIADDQGITVRNGVFSLTLGLGTTSDDLATVLKAKNSVWIEITIDGDKLSRAPVTGSPYDISGPVQLQAHITN